MYKRAGLSLIIFLFFTVALKAEGPQLVTAKWIGHSGDWLDSAQWDIGVVPDNSDAYIYNVVFDSLASTDTVTVPSGVAVNNLSLQTGIIKGGTITALGGFTLEGNTQIVSSALLSSGGITIDGDVQIIGSTISASDGLTVNGTLQISNSFFTVKNGLTVNGNLYLVNNSNGNSIINFIGTQSLLGTGQLNISSPNSPYIQSYIRIQKAASTLQATLTIGSGITIRAKESSYVYITGDSSSVNLTNQGTLLADSAGSLLQINVDLTNSGLLKAENGGILNVNSASWTNFSHIQTDNYGEINLNGGGTLKDTSVFEQSGGFINLNGTLINAGNTISINSPAASFKLTGTVQGGTIATSNVAKLIAAGGTLDGVTINGDILINASSLTIKNGLTLTGSVQLNNNSTLTIDDGLTLNGSMQLDSSTLNSNKGFTLNGNVQIIRSTLNIKNGLTVNGNLYLINNSYRSSIINFIGTQSLLGTGQLSFSSQDSPYTESFIRIQKAATTVPAFLTIGSGITIHNLEAVDIAFEGDASDVVLKNQGAIVSDSAGRSIRIIVDLTNSGLLKADNGGIINVNSASWTNFGHIQTDNYGEINLNGAGTLKGTSVFEQSGGVINLNGTFINIGNTITINAPAASFKLNGTVNGGAIATSNGAKLIAAGGTLDGVTINGDILINASSLTIKNGLTFTGSVQLNNFSTLNIDDGLTLNGSMLLDSSTLNSNKGFTLNGNAQFIRSTLNIKNGLTVNGNLYLVNNSNGASIINFIGTQSLLGTGQFSFSSPNSPNTLSYIRIQKAASTVPAVLTIGAGISIHNPEDVDIIFEGDASGVALINQGAIVSDSPGKSISISVALTNSGLLKADNGGILNVNSANWMNSGRIQLSNFGQINLNGAGTLTDKSVFEQNGGVINLNGTFINTGNTLAIDSAAASTLLSGTIQGGTIATSNGGKLISRNGTLDGVTIHGDVQVDYSSLTIKNGKTLTGSIQLEYATLNIDDGLILNGSAQLAHSTLNVKSGLTLNGESQLLNSTANISNGLTVTGTLDIKGVDGSSQIYFIDTQSLLGTGKLIFSGNDSYFTNYIYSKGITDILPATLTIGPDITIYGSPASNAGIKNYYPGDAIINYGSIEAETGVTIDHDGILRLSDPAILGLQPGSTLILNGSLLSATMNAEHYAPQGSVILNGSGNSNDPILIEAMSSDLGANSDALISNFAYGTLSLGENSYFRLIDQSDNALGTDAEAVYVEALNVPAGTTLDLNGLHIYANSAQINGTIIGGTVILVPFEKPFILWHNASTGAVYAWYMNGSARIGGGFLPSSTDRNWKIVATGDFNSDGKIDIVWRNQSTGANALWYMNGTTKIGEASLATQTDMKWTIAGAADFNNDARPDILWRNVSTGANTIWLMNGTSHVNSAQLEAVPDLNWVIAGISDFNSDHKPDILWRNISTGANAVWYMNGTTFLNSGLLEPVSDQNWIIGATADFNGDEKTDIVWRNMFTGENCIWFMDGAATTEYAYLEKVDDLNWLIADKGGRSLTNVKGPDFNGDGNADILWRNTSTGENYVWYMNGTIYAGGDYLPAVSDQNWQIAGMGDFNGDGKPDILWRNGSTGDNALWYMNGNTVLGSEYLMPITDLEWKIVGTGDFNNDGKIDLLWRNASTGANAVWFMNGATFLGSEYLQPVPDQNWITSGTGDFNGDGKVDIVWRNSATGANAVWLMNGAVFSDSVYLLPVEDPNWLIAGTGDYNKDGKTDILWRNSSTGNNAVWFMNGSTFSGAGLLDPVQDPAWTIARANE